MTAQEFADKLQELMKQFIKDSNERYSVFVFMYDYETKEGMEFGFGCPACAAECIAESLDNGEFQHQRKEEETKH